ASGGPDRTRAAARSGRTSARAARTTRARGASSQRPRPRVRAYAGPVSLDDDLEQIAVRAAAFAAPGETLTGILAAEPLHYGRVYLCSYASGDERPGWLALDLAGAPIDRLAAVREAAKLAALCEIAEESAGGGD